MSMHTLGALLDIESLSDVPVTLEVRLGCKQTTLEGLAKLDVGHTVALDRAAGETFDVFIGDMLLATAEVVIIENQLAIRITDLFLVAATSEAGL
jgi:flagellar motor switch protein FliN/FliY